MIPLVKKPQYDPAAIMPLARVVDDPTLVVAGGASPVRDIADHNGAIVPERRTDFQRRQWRRLLRGHLPGKRLGSRAY
jgi:hypothetical protein